MTIPPRKFFVGRYLVVFFADFWGRRLKEKQCLFDNGDIYQVSELALPPLPLRSTIIKNNHDAALGLPLLRLRFTVDLQTIWILPLLRLRFKVDLDFT